MERVTVEQMPPANKENQKHLIRYVNFINSRPERDLKKDGVFFNIHHIVPRSFYGSNKDFNTIKLTHREHYIAHMILWKAYGGKMTRAFWYMTTNKLFEKITNGKVYENLKWEDGLFQSDLMMRKIRITNGIKNRCIDKEDNIPRGWYLGITYSSKTGPKLGSRLITNFITSKWTADKEIPTGWFYGRPVEKMFITNGTINKKIDKEDKIPQGYHEGFTFSNKYITNGVKNRQIHKEEKIPEGWYLGFTSLVELKGTTWINNGLTCKQVYPDKIPDGWNLGMLDEHMWINNGIENKLIKIDEEIPNTFTRGRMSIGYWIHNDVEEKYTNTEDIPIGYKVGRLIKTVENTIWITNGVENKMIKKDLKIPDGFYKGITKEIPKHRLITNGKINKYLLENETIPEGWRLGSTINMKRKAWITDGIENKRWDLSEEIPVGWYQGKTVTGFWITNGKTSKLVKTEAEIPDGFKRGRFKSKQVKTI